MRISPLWLNRKMALIIVPAVPPPAGETRGAERRRKVQNHRAPTAQLASRSVQASGRRKARSQPPHRAPSAPLCARATLLAAR